MVAQFTIPKSSDYSGDLKFIYDDIFPLYLVLSGSDSFEIPIHLRGDLEVDGHVDIDGGLNIGEWSVAESGNDLVWYDDGVQAIITFGDTGSANQLRVEGNQYIAGNLQTDGNTALGNANTDTHTVVGVSTYRNAAGTATQMYVDAGNNRVLFGGTASLSGDTTPNIQVLGRLYVAPDSANDLAFQVRRSVAATSGWSLGVTSANDFVFKDITGDETFRVGDSASVYQMQVTGAASVLGLFDLTGNMEFVGASRRLRGDYTNATIANRVMLQSSTTNGFTFVGALPNGSSTIAGFAAYNNATPTSSRTFQFYTNGTTNHIINSANDGGGTNPISVQVGGVERIQMDTTGIAFNGKTPATRPDYTVTNPSTSRSLDVSAATLAELRAVVGTMLADTIDIGLYQ